MSAFFDPPLDPDLRSPMLLPVRKDADAVATRENIVQMMFELRESRSSYTIWVIWKVGCTSNVILVITPRAPSPTTVPGNLSPSFSREKVQRRRWP